MDEEGRGRSGEDEREGWVRLSQKRDMSSKDFSEDATPDPRQMRMQPQKRFKPDAMGHDLAIQPHPNTLNIIPTQKHP